jgi:hypothetical protein
LATIHSTHIVSADLCPMALPAMGRNNPDGAMMDFGFTAEQERLRKESIEFASSELQSDLVTRDEMLAFVPEMWRRCADFGILGSKVPAECGAQGRGL